jgi:PIN domain nuclease of toxin-antitoxin system
MPTSSASPEPLLLDTHYWIWMQAGLAAQLPPPLRAAIQESATAGTLLLSVISVWELGLLEARGRVQLEMECEEWVREALAMPGLVLVPLTPEIAIDSRRLADPFHGDPADRIILATARRMGARLATRDRKMLEYAHRRRMAVLE